MSSSAIGHPFPSAPSPVGDENSALEPGGRKRRTQGLKPRQDRFCEFFVATGNAADAARQAGYSQRAARSQGHRLLRNPFVEARIRALQSAIAVKIDPGLILGRLENLYRLAVEGGAYRAAARILVLQGRMVGFDYEGMAAYLRAPHRVEKSDDK